MLFSYFGTVLKACFMLWKQRVNQRLILLHTKNEDNLNGCPHLAGVDGFEPPEWQIQNLLPYRLAIPQNILLFCNEYYYNIFF